MMDPFAVRQLREIILPKENKRTRSPCQLQNMKAEISFHCKFCRGRVDDRLLQDVQLEILDHPNLACKVEDNQVLIEGCLRTDVDQESNTTGEIVCIHWKDARSFLAKSKNMGTCSTVMVQVDTPKNHFITIHCNFSENRVILLDSFQCTHGLDMYPELALELEHLMKDQNISLIPVAIQKEINDGFFHSFMNSVTVEWSKLLTTQQTYEIFLNELEFFQGVLKSTMTREKSLIDHDMKRNGSLKEIVKERIQRGVAKGSTLEDIKNSTKTVCHSLTRDIDVYIKLKYAKCVADTFLKQLQIIFETKGPSFVVRRSEVQKISEIKDIKEPFNTIRNYEQLQECATLLDSKSRLRFMKGFHDLCHYNSTSEKEIEIDERNFLNELQNHMKNIVFDMSQTSEEHPKYLKNAWKKSNNAVGANDLLKKLSKTNDRSLSKLKSLALKLSSCHSESFVISLGSLSVRFYEKVSISFVTENGVDIIRCKGSFVDLRTVKIKIKAKQDLFEKCSQIEIQADLYFLVNCDVKWRGKNVIVVTDTLIVDGDKEHFSLDVSGKNGLSHDKKEARNGTESDSDGFAGEPGMHGESGGNVQIIANVFQNAEYMYVLSGGGKGSDGQDGGSGADGISGEDGKGISEEDFNKRFPDVAYFLGSTFRNNFRAFKKNNTFATKSGCFDTTGRSLKAGEYYFNGVTDDNYAVEYGCSSINALLSFTSIVGYPNRESYCVCSGQPGSSGTPGGNGGKGGKGGKGGFEGNVDIRNWKGKQVYTIKTFCHPGQCGSDGRDGKGGIGGKNGKKDVEAFSELVNAESDSGSEMDIEGQLDADIEIVEESKTDATFSNESDLETSFIVSGNCKAFNDVHIEKDNESESESDSDITALLEWAKSNSTNKVDVCCIIEKLQYIQSENISLTLKCLRYRLINQCCQISEEFLLWLLISLLENGECIENGQYLRMIATTKPENWIFEWLIQEMMIRSDLEDESICRDVLSKVHGDNVYFFLCRYLSKLGEGELMTNHTIEVMVESLETLNTEVDESLLAVLEKTNIYEWSYQIKWNENINSLQSLPFSWQDESKLLDAAYYSSQIINRNGQKFVNEVYNCVKTYPVEQNVFLSALKRLYTGSLSINIEDLYLVESSEEASRIFGDNFIHHGIRTRDCILSIMKADSNTTLTEDQVRTIESILAQINKRSSKPSTVLTNTTEEDEDKNEYATRNILSFTQNDIKVWSQVCKQKLKSRRLRFSEIFTEIAAVIERAITLKRCYGLRNTQKISIISFLFDLDASHKGILQQMSTGEGKTIVIVVLSIVKVLQGEKVDIITSSSVLAKRDSEINKDIFDLFEISVSNNCSEDKHDRQDAYLSFVVYGEIGTFQRDILLTEFYDENIIGGRYRENVIVDEVDSMLLDRGETVLYLSHEIAGIDAIEFVYTYIWSLVNSKEMIGTDDDRKTVRQCMLDAMYGMISMKDISKCFPPENTINVHEVWNKLKKENIIDSEGRLLTRSYARFNQLGNNGTTNDGVTAGHVISMLKDTVRKGILVEIPKFLESFINRHLDTWIRNAFNAKYMEEGKHFIIDIDRTENDRGKDVNIVIMDIDTGTEQYHMRWNSGLHQFYN